jgi:hypothetical protein
MVINTVRIIFIFLQDASYGLLVGREWVILKK